MNRNQLGRSNDIYDALKLATLGNTVNDQSTGPGGGSASLADLNKIILYPTSGAPISIYEVTAAGLIAALAAAVTGDTVFVPSMTVAITSAITVPAGVALIGIDWNTVLSFSGFSGTAISCSAASILRNFTLVFVSNGSIAKGFDAPTDNIIVDHINVRVSGGSGSNSGGGGGTPVVASEIWMATSSALYWNTGYLTSGTWSKTSSLPGTVVWFGINSYTGLAYVACSGSETISKIYKSSNPKAGTPTWTQILASGDTLTGGFVATAYFTGLIVWPEYDLQANLLRTECKSNDGNRGYYGEYNGTAWSWWQGPNTNDFQSTGLGRRIGNYFDSAWWRNYNILTGGIINDTDTVNGRWWNGPLGQYGYKSASGTWYVRRITTGGASSLYTLGSYGGAFDARWTIRGGAAGNTVQLVSPITQKLTISEDGASFSEVGSAWANGWAMDIGVAGGQQIVWVKNEVAASGIPARVYSRAGSNLRDMTDNLWSLTSGDQSIVGAGIVF